MFTLRLQTLQLSQDRSLRPVMEADGPEKNELFRTMLEEQEVTSTENICYYLNGRGLSTQGNFVVRLGTEQRNILRHGPITGVRTRSLLVDGSASLGSYIETYIHAPRSFFNPYLDLIRDGFLTREGLR